MGAIDFARTLERELTAAREEINTLKTMCISNANEANDLRQQRDRLAAYRDEFEEVVEIAIDILAGNHPVIDWRDAGQSELLRKLCQHLEANAPLSARDEATEQRDRLAEALKKAKAVYTPSSKGEYQTGWHDAICWVNQQALQSLKQPEP
jgi:chromosome segregation ATPase